ncbi:YjgB family protein [Paenibacillus sp. OV219]|uniref:YjgB family protein n=1 Tax=Paenibacillus sp. OV219 TaxID=1884377 RepID=UPI0008C77512|nr:YjgB family protein [Paenibacillus sp. OV219]SEN99452.1 protein of unknown function [Paenibacillus sp. OV219]
MKKQALKTLVTAVLLTSTMMLSACSGDNTTNNSTGANSNNSTSPADSTNSDNGQSNAGNASNAPANEPGNTTNTNTNTNTNSNSAPDNTTSPSNDQSQTTKDLKAMLTLAKDGKVKGIPFTADKGLIDDVEKDWGKADKTDFAGKGMYATYAKKHAVIGFNKGSQIFDVRSDAPELHSYTLKQIEAALGKANNVTKNGSDTIYTYEANKTFELRFIISKDTGKVDHISVFAPADAVNNMAG